MHNLNPFNPCGEFRWSAEGPVNQIHYPHLHKGVPGIFSDLAEERMETESNGKLPHLLNLGKTAALVPEFEV